MKNVFLSTGEEVIFYKKLSDNEFIVELYTQAIIIDDCGNVIDGEWQPSGTKIVVSDVFETAPVKKIDKEYQENKRKLAGIIAMINKLISEIRELENEKVKLKNELIASEQKQTDLKKLIFNGSDFINSKTVSFFEKWSLNPVITRADLSVKFSIELYFEHGKIKTRAWRTQVFGESHGASRYIDDLSELYFDKTDEEMTEIAKERIKHIELNDSLIANAKDKYLTPELIERKKELLEMAKNKKVKDIQKEINNLQKKLKLL